MHALRAWCAHVLGVLTCLLNKLTPFPISRSEVFLGNCLAKKVGSFLGKSQWWNPVLIKLQNNVSKTGLRHRLFPRIFSVLEQPFCRAHVSISSWSLDAFLVREALLCSLLELATHKSTKEQLLRNAREEGFLGKGSFLKERYGCSLQLYFKKLFATLALSSR